jgi:peptidoglycan hydrolase-like protein with peptidoglycan-binding domain
MLKNTKRTSLLSITLLALALLGASVTSAFAQTPAPTPTSAKAKPVRKANPDTDYGKVQIKLREMGLYTGEITGYKNPETADALRKFQQKNGLKATGTLSAETRTKFGLPERKSRKKSADMSAAPAGQR